MSHTQAAKALVLDYFADFEAADSSRVAEVFDQYMAESYRCYAWHPFNELVGRRDVAVTLWEPLRRALTRMQRRQDVFMAGTSEVVGGNWVMSMGHLIGLFDEDWLGMRANHRLVMLRYAEFHCVEDGKIVRSGFFPDLIGLMQQLGINPLPPQTGSAGIVLGPKTQDGLLYEPQPQEESDKTLHLLHRMIEDLDALNISGEDHCPPEYLARCWDDTMLWFGPAGIGSTYTISRYQQHHQYPFREGLVDKTFNGHVCRFAEGHYACFFGWPNLSNTPSGGFLGLPGGGVRADMRVVDVYRRSGDKLVENWVLIDLPYWLKQQGLDVLERTRRIFNP